MGCVGVSAICVTAVPASVSDGGTGVCGSETEEAGKGCTGGNVVGSGCVVGAGCVSGMRGRTSVGWAAARFASVRQPLLRPAEASGAGTPSRAALRYADLLAPAPTAWPQRLQ